MAYFRAVDPFPLESADQNKLHEFYEYLAADRLVTTCCGSCRRLAWPPRGFCPECLSDHFEWVDLPHEGTVHGFSIQETGLPAGFRAPVVFAIVTVGGLRIFGPVVGADPVALRVGDTVRFAPIRVADDSKGLARHLVAFAPGARPA
ncbi:MAG: OB-fold domain-containing protein [Candidatus Rokubacteria bacterium]|nr:OB-fold domain-containing protein [Candidatus Rokubacteria bacterium]